MALIQAILSLISRSVGKILTALFDWAVVALFGRVSGRRRMLLSGLVASAAAWPLLLIGVAAPKAAALPCCAANSPSRAKRGVAKSYA